MAFEPYLMNRKRNCFRAPFPEPCRVPNEPPRLPKHDPNCTIDKYKHYFRERWNALKEDTCNPCPPVPKPLCPVKPKENDQLYGPVYNPSSTKFKQCTGICIPGYLYKDSITTNKEKHAFPWSHNYVDDCCKPDCPCCDKPAEADCDPDCTRPRPCPPLECCTTYNHFFTEKPTPCPPKRFMPDPYDPCECPLESATSYRVEYPPKSPDPQCEVVASQIRNGLWSEEQFCKCFRDDTTSKDEYPPKCVPVRWPYLPCHNLKPSKGIVDWTSETCAEYGPKCPEGFCYPEWIHNDTWIPPETPLEKCTAYKHFYRPFKCRTYPAYEEPIRVPDAIPFPSMNNMWYTCCDPKVDQRGPVEMKDNDPWPVVITCPIKYQDNLQTDPCAPFRDDTTYKADYWAKKRCAPNKWYGPKTGYTPPILPMQDNTTNRVSYVAISPEMMKEAKQKPGNPNGIYWGPYKCPPEEDKCRPRFPPPYGHPIKPYTKQCPCGQFDDRSMYHHDFKFWTPEMVDMVVNEDCRDICVPKGLSLYRRDFIVSPGKRAEIVPPPKNLGERCLRPCSIHDLDTLYMMNYRNFWKDLPFERLDKYRGKPTVKVRRERDTSNDPEPETFTIYQMPRGTSVEATVQMLEKEQKQRDRQRCLNMKN